MRSVFNSGKYECTSATNNSKSVIDLPTLTRDFTCPFDFCKGKNGVDTICGAPYTCSDEIIGPPLFVVFSDRMLQRRGADAVFRPAIPRHMDARAAADESAARSDRDAGHSIHARRAAHARSERARPARRAARQYRRVAGNQCRIAESRP